MAKGKLIQFKEKGKETIIAQITGNSEGEVKMEPKIKIAPLNLAAMLIGWANQLLTQQIKINNRNTKTKIPTAQINPNKLDLNKK